MDEELLSQLLTLLLAGGAVLISMSRMLVGRFEASTKEKLVATELKFLRQQVQNMREKTDVETQDLVNSVLQQYMDEKDALQVRVQELEVGGAEERQILTNEIHNLRLQLQDTRASLQQRIEELEAVVKQKDSRIAELEQRSKVEVASNLSDGTQ